MYGVNRWAYCWHLSPGAERNLEYAMSVLGKGVRILGPVAAGLLWVSRMFYGLVFPCHCHPSTVFFSAVQCYSFAGNLCKPAIVIACRHFEHCENEQELRWLSVLAELVALEAWGTEPLTEVEEVDPVREKLVMIVEPAGDEVYTERRALRKALRLVVGPPRLAQGLPGWLFDPEHIHECPRLLGFEMAVLAYLYKHRGEGVPWEKLEWLDKYLSEGPGRGRIELHAPGRGEVLQYVRFLERLGAVEKKNGRLHLKPEKLSPFTRRPLERHIHEIYECLYGKYAPRQNQA